MIGVRGLYFSAEIVHPDFSDAIAKSPLKHNNVSVSVGSNDLTIPLGRDLLEETLLNHFDKSI